MKISISSVVAESDPDNRKTLKAILMHMKNKKQRDSYTNYAPHLDFSSPRARTAVGEALGDLWAYCYENELPLLNLLVVSKNLELPGHGIEKWYKEKYGSLKDYDVYCDLNARIAELLLGNGNLVLV